jgi:hypothetical protein
MKNAKLYTIIYYCQTLPFFVSWTKKAGHVIVGDDLEDNFHQAPCKAFNISSAWCHLNLYLYRYFDKYAISGKDVNFDPTKISMKSWKIPKG